VRARTLFGELSDAMSASYLSGLLIGHEVRAARGRAARVHLLGTAGLGEIYRIAFSVLGIEAGTLDPDAVTAGLFQLTAMLDA